MRKPWVDFWHRSVSWDLSKLGFLSLRKLNMTRFLFWDFPYYHFCILPRVCRGQSLRSIPRRAFASIFGIKTNSKGKFTTPNHIKGSINLIVPLFFMNLKSSRLNAQLHVVYLAMVVLVQWRRPQEDRPPDRLALKLRLRSLVRNFQPLKCPLTLMV